MIETQYSVMDVDIDTNYLDVDIYARGETGLTGDTFVPSVSDQGILSWTRVLNPTTTPADADLTAFLKAEIVTELPSLNAAKDGWFYALLLPSADRTTDKKYDIYCFIPANKDPNNTAHYERVDAGYRGSAASGITSSNITSWNNKVDPSAITNFITKDVNDLTYYELKTAVGNSIELSVNSSTYVITLKLKNSAGTVISTDTIDLPLESVVVSGSYDATNQKIVLILQNGTTIDIPVSGLISGLQSEITSSNKLSSDLVDDTNHTNKFVTTTDKTNWNAKQAVLVSGTNIKTIDGNSVLGSGNLEIMKNASSTVVGGVKMRLDSTTNTLYITNNGNNA